jgi:hypothetical protein
VEENSKEPTEEATMRLGVTRATLFALPLHPAVLSPTTRPRLLEEAAAKERDADGRSEAELRWPAAARGEGPVLASVAMASISSSQPQLRTDETRQHAALLD